MQTVLQSSFVSNHSKPARAHIQLHYEEGTACIVYKDKKGLFNAFLALMVREKNKALVVRDKNENLCKVYVPQRGLEPRFPVNSFLTTNWCPYP